MDAADDDDNMPTDGYLPRPDDAPLRASNGYKPTFYEREQPTEYAPQQGTTTVSAVPAHVRTTPLTAHQAFHKRAAAIQAAKTPRESADTDPLKPNKIQDVQRIWDTLTKESRLEFIDAALAQGHTQMSVGRTLGVSPRTIREYIQLLEARRASENINTLQERIDLSTMRRLEVIRQAYNVINNRQEPATARVAALQVVQSSLDALDKLQGTQAPESVNAQALADAYYAITATLNVVTDHIGSVLRSLGLDPERIGLGPEQVQALYIETLHRQVHGTTSGVLLGTSGEPTSIAAIEAADASLDGRR